MSTPFSRDNAQRLRHLSHLHSLFENPICVTRKSQVESFNVQESHLRVFTVEDLSINAGPCRCKSCSQLSQTPPKNHVQKDSGQISPHININDFSSQSACATVNGSTNSNSTHRHASPSPLALLMMTSGSTGMPKAVCLTHEQILAAVSGKSTVRPLLAGHSFLNWVGLDHVAGLVEIHMQAILLNVDQVHVTSAEVVADPLLLLELMNKHQVTRSFAPNFLLAKIGQALGTDSGRTRTQDLDLSSLRVVATGGEANVVDVCSDVSRKLSILGAPDDVLVPGFGMTETCAGAIFNCHFPAYDVEKSLQFACLGRCMEGISMRVTSQNENGEVVIAKANQSGTLEVKGPVVFSSYYNNPKATSESFTNYGWFQTGDVAFLDSGGNLHLSGRSKDTIIINGVKHLPHQLESAVEALAAPEITPGHAVCFPYRKEGMQTEEICIAYAPTYPYDDFNARARARNSIIGCVMLMTGARPLVLPLDRTLFRRSSLGKFSRAEMKKAFEKGDYDQFMDFKIASDQAQQAVDDGVPATKTEARLLQVFIDTLNIPGDAFGRHSTLFDLGVTSVDLIRLQKQVTVVFGIDDLPFTTMISNPTVSSLAPFLDNGNTKSAYHPAAKLQSQGNKPPLWLVHPGVGEVLVFLNLAKGFTDRPIFALRARGFDGEPLFESIEETVGTYTQAIQEHQPKGPYALAVYSYGAMIAFEIAKVMQANGEEIAFVGSLNLPPHIKSRMRQLDWKNCLINLAYFLDLFSEEHSQTMIDRLGDTSREKALASVCDEAQKVRWVELGLTVEKLANWADVAFGLQSMAVDYEPSGSVKTMDVFCATPLASLGLTKEQWRNERLSGWEQFVEADLKFHDVGGAHYTMLGPDHVQGFQKTLADALDARGI